MSVNTKILFVLLSIFMGWHISYAQKDSTMFKISSWSIDLQVIAEGEYDRSIDVKELREFVGEDELLKKEFIGVIPGGGPAARNQKQIADIPLTFGFKIYARADNKKLEVSAGLRGGVRVERVLSFLQRSIQQITTYRDTESNQYVMLTYGDMTSHYFSITSKLVQVPLTIQYTSNERYRFWFTGGLEICPGLTFGYQYRGYFVRNNDEQKLVSLTEEGPYTRTTSPVSNYQEYENSSTKKNLKGLGFAGYAAVPFSANFRFTKKLVLFSYMAPGYQFTASKFIRPRGSVILVLAAGLRYKLR